MTAKLDFPKWTPRWLTRLLGGHDRYCGSCDGFCGEWCNCYHAWPNCEWQWPKGGDGSWWTDHRWNNWNHLAILKRRFERWRERDRIVRRKDLTVDEKVKTLRGEITEPFLRD